MQDPDPTNSDDDDNSRAATRGMLKLAAIAAILLVAVAMLLQILVADKTPILTEDRLEAAENLWQKKQLTDYDMDIELRGAQPGAVHVEVRGGNVVSETRNGRTPPEHTWYVWSVPGLFETLDQELVLAEDPEKNMNAAPGTKLQLRCEFDPDYGFPRRYHRFSTGGAPEVDWRVTRFEPK
jgi:hypothetical protein